jgi:NUDIX domain
VIAFNGSSFMKLNSCAEVRLVSNDINRGVSALDLRHVEEIWCELGRKGQRPPFEGVIINGLDVTETDSEVRINCGLMSYRCLVARAQRKLQSIRPVAVSGFVERSTQAGSEILLGRRALEATTHAGWYEVSPSGGLEANDVKLDGSIDVCGRLASELVEETGIEARTVEEWKPFGLYYDEPTGTIDIVIKLTIGEGEPPVSHSEEYEQLSWMGKKEIGELLACSDAPLVSVSRWILCNWLSERR